MKRLAIAIGVLGLLHLSFWLWAPWIASWQARVVLERFDSIESLGIAMEVFNDSMRVAFLVAAALGAFMLVASRLIYNGRASGWWLWLITLAVSLVVAVLSVVQVDASGGSLLRLALLGAFAYASLRAKRGPSLSSAARDA